MADKPELIIHAGLHKTGSTSLQATMLKTKVEGLQYVNWGGPNHSGAFNACFATNKLDSRTADVRGIADRARAMSGQLLDQLQDQLTNPKADKLLISAESISIARSPDVLRRFRDFFAPHVRSFRVFAYVRPPATMLASAYQQQIKNGLMAAFPGSMRVQPRLQMLEAGFGAENVTFRKFDREIFPEGDVVVDFGRQIGVDIPKEAVRRVNESVSLEATAALYCSAKYGVMGQRFQGASRIQNIVISTLNRLGGSKFGFAPEVLRPQLEQGAAEVSWLEDKLGLPMTDMPADNPKAVPSEAALEALGADLADEVMALADSLRAEYPAQAGLIEIGLLGAETETDPARRVALAIDVMKDAMRHGASRQAGGWHEVA